MDHPLAFNKVFRRQSRVFSQNGEDGVLLYILGELTGVPMYSVEIGASLVNGNLECNTAILRSNGWNGVIYDAVPITHPWCKQKIVTAQNINELVPESTGVLSIDVDGNDYWLWRALDKNPSVVIIEYNSHINPTDRLVQFYEESLDGGVCSWDGTDFFGASAGALVDLATTKGYHLVCSVSTTNLFFVHRSCLETKLPWLDISGLTLNECWLRHFKPWIGPVNRHPTYRGPKKYIHV